MIPLKQILFLDIETVPMLPSYDAMSEEWQSLWDKKAQYLIKNDTDTPADIFQRAGIYAEFGKIICISVGLIDTKKEVRIKSFYGDNEKEILEEFALMLEHYYNTENHYLAAHNGKEFDYPYIARRMLVNGLSLPKILDIAGKKPWEIRHLDTLELWKFGDYKHYTSLELLAKLFDIPTPKDDITGADVAEVYYQKNDLERIVTYCEKDVLTLIKLYLKQNSVNIEGFCLM